MKVVLTLGLKRVKCHAVTVKFYCLTFVIIIIHKYLVRRADRIMVEITRMVKKWCFSCVVSFWPLVLTSCKYLRIPLLPTVCPTESAKENVIYCFFNLSFKAIKWTRTFEGVWSLDVHCVFGYLMDLAGWWRLRGEGSVGGIACLCFGY